MTKEQYEDFRLMLKGCGVALPMYLTLNRFERVWFSSIIEILTEKDKQIAEVEIENKQLKEQIEKMRTCGNCWGFTSKQSEEPCKSCENKSHWKMKE